MLTSAALVVVSVLVKPNFMMAFLPALSVLAVLHWRHTDWRWLGLGFATPTVAVLTWQYAVTFMGNTDGASVILAPLLEIGLHSPTDLVTLGWCLVASVLFPLTAVACFSSVRRRPPCAARLGHVRCRGGHRLSAGRKRSPRRLRKSPLVRPVGRPSCCSSLQQWLCSGTLRPVVLV